MLSCVIITLFPEMFPGVLGHSLPGRALDARRWRYDIINLRDHAVGKHANVDDTPYGGGAGMVLRADVVGPAIDAARAMLPDAQLVLFSPRGALLNQRMVQQLMEPVTDGRGEQSLILLCGRFEAIDERIMTQYRPREISIGDYVLFGGEIAAQVMLEACLRYVPGVLGNPATHSEESFAIGKESAGLLEYPHYTKPPLWNGEAVPAVLTSGHHEAIATWRREQAEAITRTRRSDLWEQYIHTQPGALKRSGDGDGSDEHSTTA